MSIITRFSLTLAVALEELHRVVQVFEFLDAKQASPNALVQRELADFLVTGTADGGRAEMIFATAIGHDDPGIALMAESPGRVCIYDRDGRPNLRQLCQIVSTVLPRVLPLEFSFATLDDEARHYSGGLVRMRKDGAEILTVDAVIARRNGGRVH